MVRPERRRSRRPARGDRARCTSTGSGGPATTRSARPVCTPAAAVRSAPAS